MARENQAMQQITEFRQGNKNDKQTRTPYTFLLIVGSILVIYSLTFFYISNRIGLLSALEDVVFSTSDAHGYRLYADFIAGKSNVPNPALFDIRPFLFPLYLSVYHLIGIKGFIIIQWMLVITTIVMTYLTIRNITGSGWWGILGVLLIIMNPTFSFISLHALTETLALALLSLAVYQIISYFRVGKKRHLFLSFFFLSLLVCTKPVYLPFLLLWILYAGYRLLRLRRALLRAAILVPLALSPLA